MGFDGGGRRRAILQRRRGPSHAAAVAFAASEDQLRDVRPSRRRQAFRRRARASNARHRDRRGGPAVLICADTWNPALVHLAAIQGVTLLLGPISSALEAVGAEFDNPRRLGCELASTAMTYGMPVLMANRVGREGDLTLLGWLARARCVRSDAGSGER